MERFQQEGNAIFAKIQEIKESPQALMSQMGKYNKVVNKYTKRINTLRLPCPYSSKTTDDPNLGRYIYWARDFQAKEKVIMEGFNQEINRTLREAGFRQL